MATQAEFLETIRNSLGRSSPLATAPTPPQLDERLIRLVQTDIGLPTLFARQAAGNAMGVTTLAVEDLVGGITDLLKRLSCQTIALPKSKLFDALDVADQLNAAGLTARRWDELTVDEIFTFDAGLTDVYAAVAETGSLVVRANPDHGRSLSLVPPIHLAVVQPKDLLPDLMDLMLKLEREGSGSGTVIITGPSKTTDIEGNLVTGVHGPKQVHVFVLE